MSAFGQDLRRWLDRGHYPRNGEPVAGRLGLRRVVIMFWRYPAVWPIAIFRAASWCHTHHIRVLPTILERLNLVLFGIEISSSIPIGPGLYIAHPVGTVIMARKIGANASIIASITIGMRETPDFPVLGDGVVIGAGARILGRITVGDGAAVGANAVVIEDVPAGATAVGVPARIIAGRKEPAAADVLVGLFDR